MRTSGVPVLRRSLQLEQRGRHLDSNPHASWRQVAHTGVAVRAQRRCPISLLPPFRSQKFEPSTCSVEMPACGEALLPYLHGTPLPGRCQPVKAASRRSSVRVQHEPLQDGAGPAPWRQAGGDAGHRHSPGPRFVAKPHSTPPALRMMHSTRPARRNTSSWRT